MIFMKKLERKLGKYAIPNLTLYLIGCYVAGYVLAAVSPALFEYLTLDVYQILHGQVWRLVTWVIIPPSSFSIFTIITLYFYYSIGTSLERTWGTFQYNVYLFSGMFFTILGAFLLLVYFVIFGMPEGVSSMQDLFAAISGSFGTYYVCMSIILAFAATFPDVVIYLMFVIPVKIKWLGFIYVAMIGLNFLTSLISGDMVTAFSIAFSLLNFVIFFIVTRKSFRTPVQIKRQQEYKRKVEPPKMKGISKHKCAICGRTEKDGDDLEFRFCSKCEGNYEYCKEHLFTHTHVRKH